MLFAERVISARTYVFAEHLSSAREWVRIERVPTLLEALSQPFQPGEEHATGAGVSSSLSGAPSAGQPMATAPAASSSAPAPAQGPLLDEHAPKAVHAPCVATPRVDVTLLPANVSVRSH
jgi:hypothetical protein